MSDDFVFPLGFIRLYDAVRPTLDAGLYRVTGALEITDTHGSTLSAPPTHDEYIHITGPRFMLTPSDIAGCYPPEKASGYFCNLLPHVVLGRRTLPWERVVMGETTQDEIPWLALLVFRADEAVLSLGTLREGLPTGVVAALENGEPIDGNPQVTLLRVKEATVFRAVLPSKKEVELLAHVRQVNISDSALAGSDDDGWFAVVTANRLPLLSDDRKDSLYLACLVSLEGRNDIWNVPDGKPVPPLIVLFSWTFTCTTSGGTFDHVVRHLDVAPFGFCHLSRVEDGMVNLERVDRQGKRTSVRYRGPLLGVTADIPLGKEPDDISAHTAFELGRLLAAADVHFIREMIAWHRTKQSSTRASQTTERAFVLRPSQEAALATLSSASQTTAELIQWIKKIATRPANLWRVHPSVPALLRSMPSGRTSRPPLRIRRTRSSHK